jgi:hypothetical protein
MAFSPARRQTTPQIPTNLRFGEGGDGGGGDVGSFGDAGHGHDGGHHSSDSNNIDDASLLGFVAANAAESTEESSPKRKTKKGNSGEDAQPQGLVERAVAFVKRMFKSILIFLGLDAWFNLSNKPKSTPEANPPAPPKSFKTVQEAPIKLTVADNVSKPFAKQLRKALNNLPKAIAEKLPKGLQLKVAQRMNHFQPDELSTKDQKSRFNAFGTYSLKQNTLYVAESRYQSFRCMKSGKPAGEYKTPVNLVIGRLKLLSQAKSTKDLGFVVD